jgi:phage I-like protein
VKAIDTQFFTWDLRRSPLQFSDDSGQTWIQALPLGEWQHPLHGLINITPQRVANFVKNFYDKVRGQDLDIDYAHKEFGDQAAGWIIDVADRGATGLWLLVEWTPKALQSLKDKEYRYFSPEFADKWMHPGSKKTFKDVLFGGAITNRPFLKGITPINLSEFGHEQQQEEKDMDPVLKKLADLLGLKLADDVSDEDATSAVAEAITKLQEPKKDEPATVEEAKKLAESNPAVATLLAENARMKEEQERDRKDIRELMARNRLSEVKLMLDGLDEPGKFALSPVAKKKLSEVLVKLTEKDATDLVQAFQDTLKNGIVQLGERGVRNRGTSESGDQVVRFHETITQLQTEKKLSYADAVKQVIADQPDLWDAYQDDQLDPTKGKVRP